MKNKIFKKITFLFFSSILILNLVGCNTEKTVETEEKVMKSKENVESIEENKKVKTDDFYLGEGKKLIDKLHEIYLADSELEYYKIIEELFWDSNTYKDDLRSGLMPNVYKEAKVIVKNEKVDVSDDGKSFDYTITYESTLIKNDGTKYSVTQSNFINVGQSDDGKSYKIENIK